jgi:hypothetical protein
LRPYIRKQCYSPDTSTKTAHDIDIVF